MREHKPDVSSDDFFQQRHQWRDEFWNDVSRQRVSHSALETGSVLS